MNIRLRIGATACILLLSLAGCTRPPESPPPSSNAATGDTGKKPVRLDAAPLDAASVDAALAKATRYLLAAQSKDGAWRSTKYGLLRDGPSLTPTVLYSLSLLPHKSPQVERSIDRGLDYLAAMVTKEGKIDAGQHGLTFPVATSAMAYRVLHSSRRDAANRRARAAWLAYLHERRLGAALGWKPVDTEYGGWSFAIQMPRKPPPGIPKDRLFASNLMATRFAVAALRAANVPTSHPVYKDVLLLAARCQNYADKPQRADARFDDGGFYQNPRDPQENKAGSAGKDKWGRVRFHSYGSMTADGLWLLLQCGLPHSHPRVKAARGWLERNFTPATNPGVFQPDREFLRDSVYYYYCWTTAHAFAELKAREIQTATGKVNWDRALAAALMQRQRSDGSWANQISDGMEDDPLVGTMWATAALTLCRRNLASNVHSYGAN